MASATRADEAADDLAMMAGASVLGRLTIPGRPDQVREARRFVAKAIGERRLARRLTDAAVLLTSELVTNAVMHSNSRCPGGTVTIVLAEMAGGVRIEVSDGGSDLSAPVVKGDPYASEGHGLLLVQALAGQWGYVRDETGTTVWFWLSLSAVPVARAGSTGPV